MMKLVKEQTKIKKSDLSFFSNKNPKDIDDFEHKKSLKSDHIMLLSSETIPIKTLTSLNVTLSRYMYMGTPLSVIQLREFTPEKLAAYYGPNYEKRTDIGLMNTECYSLANVHEAFIQYNSLTYVAAYLHIGLEPLSNMLATFLYNNEALSSRIFLSKTPKELSHYYKDLYRTPIWKARLLQKDSGTLSENEQQYLAKHTPEIDLKIFTEMLEKSSTYYHPR